MSEWNLNARGNLNVYDKRNLYDHCVYDTMTHIHDHKVQSFNADPCLKAFMIAMVVQALNDIMFVVTDGQNGIMHLTRCRKTAERYLNDLEDLSFMGLPNFSGKDLLSLALKDQETVYRIRRVLVSYRHDQFAVDPKTKRRKKA